MSTKGQPRPFHIAKFPPKENPKEQSTSFPNETIFLPKLHIQFADFPLNLFATWPCFSKASNLLRFIVRKYTKKVIAHDPPRIFKGDCRNRERIQKNRILFFRGQNKNGSLDDQIHQSCRLRKNFFSPNNSSLKRTEISSPFQHSRLLAAVSIMSPYLRLFSCIVAEY